MKTSISAIVIAKNEADMIANCLETLRWCDEVIVVDHDSLDTTPEIAKRLGARVIKASGTFADIRNEGMRLCKSDWILYVDADERVVPDLATEIKNILTSATAAAYGLYRSNVLYGHVLNHGGWNEDMVIRLFKRDQLRGWEGRVHEHAIVDGEVKILDTQLLHLTHRSVALGLLKSAEWTPLEAQLLFDSGLAPVTLFTIFRKGAMETLRRIVIKKGYRDGLVGWIEALIQGINRMLVYMQVWELQQQPPLQSRYRKFEESVLELWKRQV